MPTVWVRAVARCLSLIDADLASSGSGLRLMSELRSRSNTRNASFCILLATNTLAGAATAFDLGAHELVEQGVSPEELTADFAAVDPQTGH